MPAPALRDVQRAFWAALHEGRPDPVLASLVLPSPALSGPERIGIYTAMYAHRLVDVLREDYPRTAAMLDGAVDGVAGDGFDAMARRYLARHPSEHPSVRHLGRHLPAFLDAEVAAAGPLGGHPAHQSAHHVPWLPELARLELARTDVFDAPDAVPLRAADLCTRPAEDWPGLRFVPIPALIVVPSPWPVHLAWDEAHLPDAALEARPTRLRVFRQDFRVFHVAMDPVEAEALSALIDGQPFGVICEAVGEHVPAEAAAEQAGALLARWIEDGLLAAVPLD